MGSRLALSRQFLGHRALEADAAERVAMVQTFLALMEKPEHVAQADRLLILGALFRPSAKGDGDDAAPPSWLDLVMQRIKG